MSEAGEDHGSRRRRVRESAHLTLSTLQWTDTHTHAHTDRRTEHKQQASADDDFFTGSLFAAAVPQLLCLCSFSTAFSSPTALSVAASLSQGFKEAHLASENTVISSPIPTQFFALFLSLPSSLPCPSRLTLACPSLDCGNCVVLVRKRADEKKERREREENLGSLHSLSLSLLLSLSLSSGKGVGFACLRLCCPLALAAHAVARLSVLHLSPSLLPPFCMPLLLISLTPVTFVLPFPSALSLSLSARPSFTTTARRRSCL